MSNNNEHLLKQLKQRILSSYVFSFVYKQRFHNCLCNVCREIMDGGERLDLCDIDDSSVDLMQTATDAPVSYTLVFSDTSTLMAAISDAVVSIISDLRASSD
jgi:hypothetical protein